MSDAPAEHNVIEFPRPDRDDLDRFVRTVFRRADPATAINLRAFVDDGGNQPFAHDEWRTVRLGDGFDVIVNAAMNLAGRCATSSRPVVFCPPVATFNGFGAAADNLANGLVLMIECDAKPRAALAWVEELIGPASVVVASGGKWHNPETGEDEDKLHAHWVLSKPTRSPEEHEKLRLARLLACKLVGADASAIAIVHPLRWPGSWHRKAEPRMARIVGGNPEREVDLDEALAALRDAAGSLDLGGRESVGERRGPMDLIRAAVPAVPNPDLEWDDWNRIGMAIFAATGGSDEGGALFEGWSAKSAKHDARVTKERWRHYHRSPPNGIGVGTLIWLANEADPNWRPTEAGLAVIRVVAGKRHEAADAGVAALAAGEAPFYQRDKNIVYLARFPAKASDGRKVMVPGILTVPAPLLARELGRLARWEKFDGRSHHWKRIDPPDEVVSQIATMINEWPFAPLRGVIGTQTLRPDGSLLEKPGYDEATGYVLFDPPPMPAIPDRPGRDAALAALGVLDSLLEEFPFADKPSRSVALSMLMTTVARAGLFPAVPLHVVTAPAGGTGKSYLIDLASAISIGEPCPVIAKAPRDEETEKRLIGAALTGGPIIGIDNCNGELRSEFLCQVVERPVIQSRPLGTSEMMRIPNGFTVFANGNNIQIADDLVRRTLQCSLDANMERPEERAFTKKPFEMVVADRGRYVAAALTIIRAYVAAGMPDRPAPLLSFGGWSDLVRAPLIWLDRADPVDTIRVLAAADPVQETTARVFEAIGKLEGSEQGFTTSDLVGLSGGREELSTVLSLSSVAGERSGEVNAERLGKWLSRHRNRIAGGFKLIRDSSTSRPRWAFAWVGAEPRSDERVKIYVDVDEEPNV